MRLTICTFLLLLVRFAAGQATEPVPMRMAAEDFGKTADGVTVQRFTLQNAHGMTLKVMSLGATITELWVPDRAGVSADVVLGAKTFEEYQRSFSLPAMVPGRVANRIAGAKFTLDGVEYTLDANNGPHSLHGGRKGFGTVVWQGMPGKTAAHESSVTFTYLSKDGEAGYPGNLTAKVTYTLTDSNELRLDYEATTDKTTLVNLTNHAYFHLGGVGNGNILGHELWIDADRYTVADRQLIPTGEIAPVKGTPLDFTTPTVVGSRLDQLRPMNTYDHNFVLNSGGKAMALAARLSEPKSGRVMEVRTDQPGLQLYTGNAQHPGLCLEPQHFPDAIHHPEFPSIVLRPGEKYKTTTVFTFTTK